jgi:ABC-type antimicrobial peptide transport system permease subunit
MAYSVAERTREIGIRMALGAGGDEVLRLIARQAAIVISIGLMLGLAGSLPLTRLLKRARRSDRNRSGDLYSDLARFVAVAVLACLVPTRRAITVNPTVALRYE